MKTLNKVKINQMYLDSVFEEYANLHFIANSSNGESILAIDKTNGKVYFFYYVNREISMACNMFSEIGERFKSEFKSILDLLNYKIVSKETETDYFDTIENY